jgi:hypothetical protein
MMDLAFGERFEDQNEQEIQVLVDSETFYSQDTHFPVINQVFIKSVGSQIRCFTDVHPAARFLHSVVHTSLGIVLIGGKAGMNQTTDGNLYILDDEGWHLLNGTAPFASIWSHQTLFTQVPKGNPALYTFGGFVDYGNSEPQISNSMFKFNLSESIQFFCSVF